LRSKRASYTVSHDSKDAPRYDHRLYKIFYPILGADLLCIEDTDRTHNPFLKQWQGMEIDIENQWSVNNGSLGLEVLVHKDGKHKMKFMVRVKMVHAKIILNTPLRAIGICDERKRILLPVSLPNLKDLTEFYELKKNTDDYIKQNHLYPKGWTIE
jgi:hypothetical protein